METRKDLEQKLADSCENSEPTLTKALGTSRRKFTRNALVGSAVLLTLSNRSAWGTKVLVCASANLLVSYGAGRPSTLNLTTEQQKEIDDYELYYNDRKNDPVDIQGDMCYEINTPNENSKDPDF